MNTGLSTEILSDKIHLNEIFHLRKLAYLNSPKSKFIEKDMFPEGMYDDLDFREETVHFVIREDSKIIAAARLAIVEQLQDIDEPIKVSQIPPTRPFGYLSRLVVHPDYRKKGLGMDLYKARCLYLSHQEHITFAVVWATRGGHENLTNLGFKTFTQYTYSFGGNSIILFGYILHKDVSQS